jgi:hypothetical protein
MAPIAGISSKIFLTHTEPHQFPISFDILHWSSNSEVIATSQPLGGITPILSLHPRKEPCPRQSSAINRPMQSNPIRHAADRTNQTQPLTPCTATRFRIRTSPNPRNAGSRRRPKLVAHEPPKKTLLAREAEPACLKTAETLTRSHIPAAIGVGEVLECTTDFTHFSELDASVNS